MHRAFSFGHAPFSFPDSALIVCWSNRTANLLTSGSIPHAWHDPHDTLAVSIAPNGIGVARMTFYHWAGALPHWHPVRFRGLNSIVRNDAKLRHQVYRDPQPHACVARVIFSTIHTHAPAHTSSHVPAIYWQCLSDLPCCRKNRAAEIDLQIQFDGFAGV